MKSLSKRDKPKSSISLKMTGLITFLDNNRKLAIYIGGNIHGLCHYLEMIGDQTTFTTSGQNSHHFGPSYSTNNDTATLQ